MERMTQKNFYARCKAQFSDDTVEARHWAFKCPMCSTVQSAESLFRAGAIEEIIDGNLGFSCVGRFSGAGEYNRKTHVPGSGCNWTLGGFLQIHQLEVELETGGVRPCFEIATPDEAQALYSLHTREAA